MGLAGAREDAADPATRLPELLSGATTGKELELGPFGVAVVKMR
jgi:hypothetical protein